MIDNWYMYLGGGELSMGLSIFELAPECLDGLFRVSLVEGCTIANFEDNRPIF
jgi:hypothetical protein